MTDLQARHCTPLTEKTPPMEGEQAGRLLEQLHADWTLAGDNTSISRTFRFKNYYQTLAFVNALAWIAHGEDHHPDLEIGYNRCLVRYSTHAVGGLSENDFICAARIDALLPEAD
ncbi:MAG: 4a-hydroxytetrahydrobiopterin dehydratase [Gammaproteobacteria bacterium]